MKMHFLSCFFILVVLHFAGGQVSGPTVEIENGFLMGTLDPTVGGKPYYSFKGIYFADPTDGPRRFKEPEKRSYTMGTPSDPYDATRNGPLCPSTGTTSEDADRIRSTNITDAIVDLAEGSLGVELDPEGFLVQTLVAALEELLEFEEGELEGQTVGYVLENLLGIYYDIDEDCLHLSVHTPRNPSEVNVTADLPVMVFIHGGAFIAGSNVFYDHQRLGDAADVVVVSLNYRLGPLGFMCLNTDESPGNQGLMDQVEALRWVRDNIHNFGGDPDQVTIFGESAGSASVSHLILASGVTEGLFKRAIGMSGSATAPWAFDQMPVFHAKRIAQKLSDGEGGNCDSDDHAEIVTCMRDQDATDIQNAFRNYSREERRDNYRLGFGGSIPCGQTNGTDRNMFYTEYDNPTEALQNGDYDAVPIMFGANSHEGSFIHGELYNDFLVGNDLVNDTDWWTHDYMLDLLRVLEVSQGIALKDLLEGFYFREDQIGRLEKMTPGLIDFESAFFIKATAYQMVQENSMRAPSYFYSVEHASRKSFYHVLNLSGERPPNMDENGLPGVCHADDLMYIFNYRIPFLLCDIAKVGAALIDGIEGCPQVNPLCFIGDFKAEWDDCILGELTPEEEVWARYMTQAFTNFAIHGTPTPGDNSGIPPIAPYDRNAPNYLAFRPQGPAVVGNYLDSLNDVMEKASPLPPDGGNGGSRLIASLLGTAAAVILATLLQQ